MKVNLMTKEIIKNLPPVYATDGYDKKEVAIKFFTPDANWTWYVFEGTDLGNGDFEFFGLVDGLEPELGYFTLNQLKEIRGKMGLPVERDRHFTGTYNTKTKSFE